MNDQAAESRTRPLVSGTDLKALDLSEAFSGLERPTCWNLTTALNRYGKGLGDQGDVEKSAAAYLLGAVCSFYFRPDMAENPWGPLQYTIRQRSIIAEDLYVDELSALAELAPSIETPELQARVADVLWECGRGHAFARLAIEAYAKAAEIFEDEIEWFDFLERWERMLDLSAKLGRRDSRHLDLLHQIESLIEKYNPLHGSMFLCGRLMHLLLDYRHGDPARYAAISESLAKHHAAEESWDLTEAYWRLAMKWHSRGQRPADSKRCHIEVGETMISRGSQTEIRGKMGAAYSAHWFAKGIETLRQAQADPLRIQQLHLELLALQKASLEDLERVKFDPANIHGYEQEQAAVAAEIGERLAGLALDRAVGKLALMPPMTNVTELRDSITKGAGSSLHLAIGSSILDHDGKTTASAPGISLSDAESNELAITKRMFQQAAHTLWPLVCDWYILPAQRAITSAHRINARSMTFLVQGNPIIGDGHEGIYLRAVVAGFYGDYLISSSLLIPQLEHSIRRIFESYGIITSSLEDGGNQRDHDLGWLLTHPRASEILGERLTFDLRGILIERFGHNLRNEMAHGLMHEGAFYSEAGCYIWWLAIHLLWCGHHYLSRKGSPRSEDSPDNNPQCAQE